MSRSEVFDSPDSMPSVEPVDPGLVRSTAPGTSIFGSVEFASHLSPDGLLDVTLFSWALHRRADVSFFAPRGVDEQAALPLVVLLHGVFGSHWAWARSGLAHRTLQELVDAGTVRPMILAMPSDGLFGIGSGYVAGGDGDAEKWIVDEVPAAARLRYPTAGDAGSAVAGVSMGGWGALRLAARHTGRYRAAAGISPLTRWEHVAAYATPRHRDEHRFSIESPDLGLLLTERVGSLPPVRITCGTEDDLLHDVRTLSQQLVNAGVTHDYAESPGGHEWPVWESELRSTLIFIDSHL